jgi:predicted NBD/HSP70 family sugar kinase/predicted transcriptional regulator
LIFFNTFRYSLKFKKEDPSVFIPKFSDCMKHLKNFKPTENGTSKEGRQFEQLKSIVNFLSKSNEALTIPEIAEFVKISVPTCNKLVKELVDKNLVIEEGKKEVENGRRPNLYALKKENFYAVGAEILEKWIHVSVDRVDLETVHEAFSRTFVLEDTQVCLDYIVSFIKKTIDESSASLDQIIGVGLALTGSVNGNTGESADYFKNIGVFLREYLGEKLALPVTIDNDTRVLGIAEQVLGGAKGVDNVLIVNVSRNLGLSIILDKNMIFGAWGFAGHLGHVQFGTKGRLCTCGKKNCLRTEVSGDALYMDLKEALKAGETSIYFNLENIEKYKYHDVLDAVNKGDALSIKLLTTQGEKLGQSAFDCHRWRNSGSKRIVY